MAGSANIQDVVKQRFAQLPKVVQDAITSANIEKHLRELADTHKLHLDQWENLENEVLMALLGATQTSALKTNIKNQVGVTDDVASALATDISKVVFESIRAELERGLGSPDAKEAATTPVEQVRVQVLAEEKAPPAPAVAPATPPIPAPTDKAARAPISESYKAGEPSSARKAVHDDPYREPPA